MPLRWAPAKPLDDPLRDFAVNWQSSDLPILGNGLRTLLNGPVSVDDVASYLRSHPQLLVEHLSGGHGRWVLPQSALNVKESPDFVVGERDSIGTRWQPVVLGEPPARMFLDDGDPSVDLSRSLRRIEEWRWWLDGNRDYAVRARSEGGLGLSEASSRTEGLIIIGRRAGLLDRFAQLRRQMGVDRRIRIHTYDFLPFLNDDQGPTYENDSRFNSNALRRLAEYFLTVELTYKYDPYWKDEVLDTRVLNGRIESLKLALNVRGFDDLLTILKERDLEEKETIVEVIRTYISPQILKRLDEFTKLASDPAQISDKAVTTGKELPPVLEDESTRAEDCETDTYRVQAVQIAITGRIPHKGQNLVTVEEQKALLGDADMLLLLGLMIASLQVDGGWAYDEDLVRAGFLASAKDQAFSRLRRCFKHISSLNGLVERPGDKRVRLSIDPRLLSVNTTLLMKHHDRRIVEVATKLSRGDCGA